MAWQITRLNPAVPNARQHQSSGEGQDQPPTQNKTPKSAHSRLFLGQIRRASLRDILSASAFVLSSNLADIVLLLPLSSIFAQPYPLKIRSVSMGSRCVSSKMRRLFHHGIVLLAPAPLVCAATTHSTKQTPPPLRLPASIDHCSGVSYRGEHSRGRLRSRLLSPCRHYKSWSLGQSTAPRRPRPHLERSLPPVLYGASRSSQSQLLIAVRATSSARIPPLLARVALALEPDPVLTGINPSSVGSGNFTLSP